MSNDGYVLSLALNSSPDGDKQRTICNLSLTLLMKWLNTAALLLVSTISDKPCLLIYSLVAVIIVSIVLASNRFAITPEFKILFTSSRILSETNYDSSSKNTIFLPFKPHS